MTNKEKINVGDKVLTNRILKDGEKQLPVGTEGIILTADSLLVTISYKDGDRRIELNGSISVDYLDKA
jgi:hypothetical protein